MHASLERFMRCTARTATYKRARPPLDSYRIAPYELRAAQSFKEACKERARLSLAVFSSWRPTTTRRPSAATYTKGASGAPPHGAAPPGAPQPPEQRCPDYTDADISPRPPPPPPPPRNLTVFSGKVLAVAKHFLRKIRSNFFTFSPRVRDSRKNLEYIIKYTASVGSKPHVWI